VADAISPQALSELIGSIYDCALDPTRWEETLPSIEGKYARLPKSESFARSGYKSAILTSRGAISLSNPHPFAAERRHHSGEAGDAARRTSGVVHNAGDDRVGARRHDDGNRPCLLQDCALCWTTGAGDYVRNASHQVLCPQTEHAVIGAAITNVHAYVDAIDPAQILGALPKCSEIRLSCRIICAAVKRTDAV